MGKRELRKLVGKEVGALWAEGGEASSRGVVRERSWIYEGGEIPPMARERTNSV